MEYLKPESNLIEEEDKGTLFLLIILFYVLKCLALSWIISGILVGRASFHISHLFFAYDSLLFCKANTLEWSKLYYLLQSYESTLG